MKSNPILKKQTVSRKKRGHISKIWGAVYLVGSCLVKFSVLIIALIIISLLFLGSYQYLQSSPLLKLEEVIVSGVDGEIKGELLKLVLTDSDMSLLAVNMNELRQKIEKHPWISSVKIQRRFPHTLIIRAEKEVPVAMVAAGKIFYMDQWGKVFKEVDPIEDMDYPVITGISIHGDDREEQLKSASLVLNVLKLEKGPWSLKGLSEIHVGKDGNVSMYFCSVPAVIRVKGTELNEKLERLKKVVEHLNSTGRIHMVRGINLHYKDGAVVSFKESEVPRVSESVLNG